MKMNRIIASAVSAALIAAACVPFSANAATDPDGNGIISEMDAYTVQLALVGAWG